MIQLIFGIMFIGNTLTPVYAQGNQVYKIGLSVWTGYPSSIKGFKEAVMEGGFIEGINVKYFYGKSGISQEKQKKIAQQ